MLLTDSLAKINPREANASKKQYMHSFQFPMINAPVLLSVDSLLLKGSSAILQVTTTACPSKSFCNTVKVWYKSLLGPNIKFHIKSLVLWPQRISYQRNQNGAAGGLDGHW